MKQNLVVKILGKIKIFVQDFVPIKTGVVTAIVIFEENALARKVLKNPTDFRELAPRLSRLQIMPSDMAIFVYMMRCGPE